MTFKIQHTNTWMKRPLKSYKNVVCIPCSKVISLLIQIITLRHASNVSFVEMVNTVKNILYKERFKLKFTIEENE